MPHFMIILILYINLLNLFSIKKCLFLTIMEPLTRAIFEDNFCYFGTKQLVLDTHRDTSECSTLCVCAKIKPKFAPYLELW